MADTAVALTTFDADGINVKIGQGTAIVHANNHVITPSGPLEELLILVTNTEGSTNVVTVLAGDAPPALSSGLGDRAFDAVAATTGHQLIFGLESARFLQNDGTVRLTVETGMTGWIQAIQLPRV